MPHRARVCRRDAARRIALAAQGFTRPRPSGRVTRRHLRRVFDDIGLIQIDSVNVLVRSQELPLFARLGPHPRTLIPDAVAAGELFEYWAHVASLVPTKHLPLFRWRMAAMVDGRYARHFTQRRPGMLEQVLDQVRAQRPDRRRRRRGPGPQSRVHGGTGTTPSSPSRSCSTKVSSASPGGTATLPGSTTSSSASSPLTFSPLHRSRSTRLGGNCCSSLPARSGSPRSRSSATTTG